MGKCVKCGRETPHSYTYYCGKRIGSNSRVMANNQTMVTATYAGVMPRTEYFCGRHSYLLNFLVSAGCTFLILIFVGALIFSYIVGGNETDTVGVIIGFAIVLLVGLVCSVYYGIALFKNKRLGDDEAAVKLIAMAEKKDNTLRYFTPTEWKKLS